MNVVRILGQLAHEQGCCVIAATRDPEAAGLADQVYRVREGELTAAGGTFHSSEYGTPEKGRLFRLRCFPVDRRRRVRYHY